VKPIVKYQGGKSKELPIIKSLLPKEFKAVIEPFCGGAAVSFALEKEALLLDINPAVINLYKAIQDPFLFQDVFSEVCYLKTLSHDALQEKYYTAREYINGTERDPYTYAASYITVRQLCFSGMERYNSKGEFNVPFGHYRRFSCNLDWNHLAFLKKCQIHEGDFSYLFNIAEHDDWIFIDPPYLDRLGYTGGDGGTALHDRLVQHMKSTSAKWLFIHNECDYYMNALKDFNIHLRPMQYAQRFGKDKNHANALVNHMYVTNYTTSVPLEEAAQGDLQNLLNVA
tara:strand:+ start:1108 stop:1959 length:852 start_codon:yes stop_codon:yes gene_type:complete